MLEENNFNYFFTIISQISSEERSESTQDIYFNIQLTTIY